MENRRPLWSWAQGREDAVAFQEEASRLAGKVLSEVRYITLDYRSDQFRGDVAGPRYVSSVDEWAEPSWRHPACDTVDFAVEFFTETGPVFTASWDSPGAREGLGLREGSAVGMAVADAANAAIWDVSQTMQWRDLVGCRVDSVELCYEPWDETGALWCRRIDLKIGAKPVTLLLAEGVWDSDELAPSADNVAVVSGTQIDAPWEADAA